MPSALDFLAKARELGLLGPASLDLHRRHALGFAAALQQAWADDPATKGLAAGSDPPPNDLRILDLGSGAGVPGLVLAELWPRASIRLLDASQRRCLLLEQWVSEAGWSPRVSVLCGRAEDLGRDLSLRATFDVVVARLFGRPPVTAECAAPFLRVGGLVVASDPPGEVPDQEMGVQEGPSQSRWPTEGLALLGLEGAAVISKPFHFTVLRQSQCCPERYPRRTGMPAKRPLF